MIHPKKLVERSTEELEESLVTAAVLLSKADSSGSLVTELLDQAGELKRNITCCRYV